MRPRRVCRGKKALLSTASGKEKKNFRKETARRKESRWKDSFENLDSKPGATKIDDLVFNTKMKIADGCNAAEIFPGLFNNCLVAVKRVAKHVSKNELEMARFLSKENLQAEHLLQPVVTLEDSYFAFLVSPLCEYSLTELIENKDFPERQSLTEQRRLEICQDLLRGLQELHSHGILHRDLKPGNILFDNNKLCIADFGASRKLDLGQMTGSFSWSSYEDVGGPHYKYSKESDIQVAGCLVHYILTDGQHPYQTMTPYSSDPVGISQNVRTGNFTLQCEERWIRQKGIITRMLSRSLEDRPTIEECLQAFTCVTNQSDYTGTNNSGSEKRVNDRTDTADSCLPSQTMMDSFSDPGRDLEEVSVCEMSTDEQISLSLEMSDVEEKDKQAKKVADKEVIGGRPSKKRKAMDQNANGSDEHHIQVKTSSNTAQQRIYDKKSYCLYCEKPYAKITRHLTQMHSDKIDVAKALAQRQGSAMRNNILSKIRNMGNYHHNCLVLSSGKGQIVPKRQAIYPSAATDYQPCKFCFAMYVKTDLVRHQKRCKNKATLD